MIPLADIFVQALFKATEMIWEKSFNAAWDPVHSGLLEKFTQLAGKDKERERRKAFKKASEAAIKATIARSGDPDEARKILSVVTGSTNPRLALLLAEESSKVLLFADQPDLERMLAICQREVKLESLLQNEKAPGPEEVFAVLKQYLDQLRRALVDQPEYNSLITKEILRILSSFPNLRIQETPFEIMDSKAEETYLSQVIHQYQNLDFVGIPELRDRQSIKIEDIFIRLWAEGES